METTLKTMMIQPTPQQGIAVKTIHAFALFCAMLLLWPAHAGAEVLHSFITWHRDDTARTLAIHLVTDQTANPAAEVLYDREPRGGSAADYRFRAEGRQAKIPGLDHVYVQKIELRNLTPNCTFHFIAGSPETGYTTEKSFRSLPLKPSTLKFVTGGDMGVGDRTRALCREAAKHDPGFVLIGGDLAYANGRLSAWKLWRDYLAILEEELVRSDGTIIPILATIGNHEVNNDIQSKNFFERSPFYMHLFAPKDGPTYFRRSFGDLLVLLGLDTGHLVPHGGRQSQWLQYQLEQADEFPYLMACYHVPLYPSHREYDGSSSQAGRKWWLPLFDRYRLSVGLENHDHTLKRTIPLYGNKPAPEGQGTIYIGDGCFGRDPRTVEPERWYLAHAKSTPHFWVVDLHADRVTMIAYDENGEEVDRTSRPPRPPHQ